MNIKRMRIDTNNGADFICFEVKGGHTIEITDLNVRSNRRSGVGTWLVRQMESQLAEPKLQTVYAITRESNLVAIAFYSSLGFKEAARVSKLYQDKPNGEDGVVFTKTI